MGRVGDELPLHPSDTHGPERSIPGNITDRQCGGGADDAKDVGIIFAVGTEQNALDLHFVVIPLWEKGSNGPVGEARGQDFLLRGAALTFEVTPWEFSGG